MSPLLLAGLLALLPQEPEPAAAARGERGDGPDTYLPAEVALDKLSTAAERGLRWLAARQLPSGAFTGIVGHKQGDSYYELDIALPVASQERQGRGHMGVTALCGLAFLSGGHLPDRGPYGGVVEKTIAYTVAHAHENGLLTDSGTRMYSHAFATLFLAEVCGMTGGGRLEQTLERAVQLMVDCQNSLGGWRYNPFDRELDLSVTVCQLQALRAARNIGIKVPTQSIDRAIAYVQRSRTPRGRDRGLYYYKIYGRGAYDKNRDYAINAAALTALHSAGIYDPDQSDAALEFLLREYRDVAYHHGDHFYFWYGNYYACQAFFQVGGDRFRRYYAALSRDLLEMQQPDGRWTDRVGPGDEFSTAIACLLLQLPKQYLPIFQR